MSIERPKFLDQEPPKGYIPGLGRGATGFSTRGEKNKKIPKRFGDTNENETNKFNDLDDDDDATKLFELIDSRRNGKTSASKDHNTQDSINLGYGFNDLKRNLKTISEEEWLNIPEASDFTRRNKRNRLEEQLNRKTYAAPDALITQNVDLTKLTEEREKLLKRKLDTSIKLRNHEYDAVSVEESKTRLQELESIEKVDNFTQSEDLRKMRIVFRSYRKSDPKKSEGWIASARLEEKCNKFVLAKNLIEEGCQNCPYDEDIWLESIRLHLADSYKCKVIAASAIKFNPKSTRLWIKAVDLENETINKYRVVRKALQEIPTSEEIWKLAVSYEINTTGTIKILEKALEFIPQSIDLWTALVKLQDSQDAKKSLNKARKLIVDDIRIWILAIELEEESNSIVKVPKLIKILTRGFEELISNGVELSLQEGLEMANMVEINNGGKNLKSLQALIETLIMRSIDTNSSLDDQIDSINKLVPSMTKIYCYRKLIQYAPSKFTLWKSLQKVCEKLEKINELYDTFELILFNTDITNTLKENSKLSLVYAKEVWKYSNDIEKAVSIIDRALSVVPNSLDILFAKIKLLCQSKQFHEVDILFLERINEIESQNSSSEIPGIKRLYYKYVSFLRFKSKDEEAIKFLKEKCLSLLPNCYKFYLQLGQIYFERKQYDQARAIYSEGVKKFPNNVILWISLSKLDEIALGKPTKARADLDLAIVKNSNNIENEILLNVEKIQLEKRTNNKDQARLVVTQNLKKYPNNELFWVENIRLLDTKHSSQKKTTFQDALKKTQNNHLVLLAIGVSFYHDSQFSSAIKWIERATKSNPIYGDSWVWLYRCQQRLNRDTKMTIREVKTNEPVYGPEWTSVSKNPATQYLEPTKILEILVE